MPQKQSSKISSVESHLQENRSFPPKAFLSEHAHIRSQEQYEKMYKRSLRDSESFWLEQAETLKWIKKPTKALEYTWNLPTIKHTWFEDGILNVSENCLDRHLAHDKIALIWQGDEDSDSKTFSYRELHHAVCLCANALKSLGIRKGDRICIYLPMIPELVISVLACARIGAIHSVVFGGFSAESLSQRINDSTCKLLITANEGVRGGKKIPLKQFADEALIKAPSIENVIVVKRTDAPCEMKTKRDYWYHDLIAKGDANCPPEPMNAEDPLFILYTSGSTGNPKGTVHTQAGYLLQASLTHKYIFDIQEGDVYWCTADIGWVTGHSYIVYGPLANRSTIVMFEGVPTYPDPGRFWQIVEKYRVNVFYTAPTAIRALIQAGNDWPRKYDLRSLKILGTVGEPINPEVWMWYYEVIGRERCPIVDTWWQTETGGILISALPGVHHLKPGSASKPFFGVDPVIMKDQGQVCTLNEGGSLCIKKPWPGIMRTTWGDHERFIQTYFTTFPNLYFSGDGCRQDSDGDYWLLGRIDDVINVSGHRIGAAEVESALVSHPAVAEAAVVAMPHPIKGQGLYAFVTLVKGEDSSLSLKKDLIEQVRREIGPIAIPDKIQFAIALPKTRSGKIMRRILRKIAENNIQDLGDITTLADPHVVEVLINEREKDE